MPATRSWVRVVCLAALLAPALSAQEQQAPEGETRQQRLLRRFDRNGDGQIDEQERQAIRQQLEARQASRRAATQPSRGGVPPGVQRRADIEYARVGDQSLLLDIYKPEETTGPLPVILWIHGGAWVSGNKNNCPIASFAAKGYAVVSINYRLSGTAQFPAQIHDCKAAVRWVRAHAGEHGFDPGRVGACGGSAGGHLVALLGTSGDVKELEGDVGGNLQYSSRVRAVADFCGPADFIREDYVRPEPTTQPAIVERALAQLLGGPWEQKREAARMASPVSFISKDDPPFLIVHGDADPTVPFKHSQRLHDLLKEARLDVTLHVVKGGGHGVGGYPGVLEATAAFFDKHLKQAAGPARRPSEASGRSQAPASAPAEEGDLSDARRMLYRQVGDVKLNLYFFMPPDWKARDRRPAIVFFFGGGWLGGSPGQFVPQCRYLASRGMVAATADYRVYTRHRAMIADCTADAQSAIRWVRAHAIELGIDPDRIAASGGSAGGHLAAATATLQDFTGGKEGAVSFRPNALVLFNPALDLTPDQEQAAHAGERMRGIRARMGAKPEELSPADHIRAGLPPTIIFHGEQDELIPIAKIRDFARVMKEAGNRCEVAAFDGQGHGFFNLSRSNGKYFRETLTLADRFLASLGYVKGEPAVAHGAD